MLETRASRKKFVDKVFVGFAWLFGIVIIIWYFSSFMDLKDLLLGIAFLVAIVIVAIIFIFLSVVIVTFILKKIEAWIERGEE